MACLFPCLWFCTPHLNISPHLGFPGAWSSSPLRQPSRGSQWPPISPRLHLTPFLTHLHTLLVCDHLLRTQLWPLGWPRLSAAGSSVHDSLVLLLPSLPFSWLTDVIKGRGAERSSLRHTQDESVTEASEMGHGPGEL